MTSKLEWAYFGTIAFITLGLVVMGLYLPTLLHPNLIFMLILLMCIILGISAAFLFKFKNFKILAWCIFVVALIANCIWFFFVPYSVLIFSTICNLCFMFIYTLFFIQMPYYAIKYQPRYERSTVGGYHIHENLYGIVLVVLGFILARYIWSIPVGEEVVRFLLRHTLTYFGIFCVMLGGFLIGRDYQDLLEFKFIEKAEKRVLDPHFNVREQFYRTSPAGIVLILFGISLVVQSQPLGYIFFVDRFLLMNIGFMLISIGGAVSGLNPTYFAKKTNIL